MRNRPPAPITRLTYGLIAGACGTAAMTFHQDLRSRLANDEQQADPDAASNDEPRDPWQSAPAPAQVAKHAIEALAGARVPSSKIPMLTQVMHWSYGIGWGAIYGFGRNVWRKQPVVGGALFGSVVWAASYAQLVPLGIYEPPWRYSAAEIADDLGYHLTYGLGVALAFAAIERLG